MAHGFHIEFYALCAVLGWLALRGLLSGRGVFEFPTVAAMMGIAWVVPLGIELESDPSNFYASGNFWLYVTACFLFLAWGFRLGRKGQLKRIQRTPEVTRAEYNLRRLLVAAGGLTALGLVSVAMMYGTDTSSLGTQWTGIITMYQLFSSASGMGLCLAMLVFARTRSALALGIAVVASTPLIAAALGGVRREQLFDLLVLTAGSWYIVRRSFPPRLAVIICLVVGTVVLNKAGELRSYIASDQGSFLDAIVSDEIYKEFNYFALEQGESSEVGLAQHDFWYMNQNERWEYGAGYWNKLVHQYVPAFIVGRDYKEDLKLDTLSERLRLDVEDGKFSAGSTRTGFSDTYSNFGFIGVFVFLVIGYGFGMLYGNLGSGSITAQYFYLILLAEGLKSITHSTAELVSALPFVIGLSLIALHFARVRPAWQDLRHRGVEVRSGDRGGIRSGVLTASPRITG